MTIHDVLLAQRREELANERGKKAPNQRRLQLLALEISELERQLAQPKPKKKVTPS